MAGFAKHAYVAETIVVIRNNVVELERLSFTTPPWRARRTASTFAPVPCPIKREYFGKRAEFLACHDPIITSATQAFIRHAVIM